MDSKATRESVIYGHSGVHSMWADASVTVATEENDYTRAVLNASATADEQAPIPLNLETQRALVSGPKIDTHSKLNRLPI